MDGIRSLFPVRTPSVTLGNAISTSGGAIGVSALGGYPSDAVPTGSPDNVIQNAAVVTIVTDDNLQLRTGVGTSAGWNVSSY